MVPEYGNTSAVEFESVVERIGLRHGREGSVKLTPDGVLDGRVLVGFHASELTADRTLSVCRMLGMPPQAEPFLAREHGRASVVLFGVEPREQGCTFKAYLEFWDDLRNEVRRTGSLAPRLLHLGAKWEAKPRPRFGWTRYVCHPMLPAGAALGRMAAVCEGCEPRLTNAGSAIVEMAARRSPGTRFVYLEAEDDEGARRSYDINLYKAGLRVGEVLPLVLRAAEALGLRPAASWRSLMPHLARPLGHLSSGRARDGKAFLTLYYEVDPMPPRPTAGA